MKINIEYVVGSYGSSCLTINDYRITSDKLWGIGHTINRFTVDLEILKNIKELEIYKNELYINGIPTQGNQTKEQLENYLNKIKTSNMSHKRIHRHIWKVNWSNIEEALNY